MASFASKILPAHRHVIAHALTRLTREGSQTIRLSLDFFDQDQTSLDNTRRHLTRVAKRIDFSLDFLSSGKSSEKSSRLAGALTAVFEE